MKQIYCIFYEKRHSGTGVTFISKKNAYKWINDQDNHDSFVYLINYDQKDEYIYFPYLQEVESGNLKTYELNNITLSSTTKESNFIKIKVSEIKIGFNVFEKVEK